MAFRLLQRIVPSADRTFLNGEFESLYMAVAEEKGRLAAFLWVWKEIFVSFPGFLYAALYWRITMFKNYFVMALRNVKRNKLYSVINMSGLILGMSVCLLIFLWIRYETGFDRFHAERENIAQVYSETVYSSEKSQIFTGSYYPLAKLIKVECPEIREAVRFETAQGLLIRNGNKKFTNDVVGLADPDFFKIFSFPLVKGNPETVFSEKYAAVLTESMARKYFGDDDPVGKTLNVNSAFDVLITGIMKDIPYQSSLRFDCLVPFIIQFAPDFKEPDHWGGNPLTTYVLLHKMADLTGTAKNITSIVNKIDQPETTQERFFRLHPLTKIHLYSPEGGGAIQTVTLFAVIAFFVLIIASINYMNLSTARTMARIREIGVRKAVGAERNDLIRQFIGESVFLSIFTMLLSILIVGGFLSFLNKLLETNISLKIFWEWKTLLGIFGIAVFTGLLSGSYPAFYLAGFQPAGILRGIFTSHRKSSSFRKALVVFQFSLSVLMIISTAVVFRQMRFIQNKDMGFERENLVILQMGRETRNRYPALKTELLRNPDILSVSRSMQGIWNIGSTVSALNWDGKDPDNKVYMHWDWVGYDYLKTMGIKIIAGRDFSKEYASDLEGGTIINEAAAALMGKDSPVGERLSVFRKEGRIIGLVKNFHFQPLYHEVKPFVLMLRPDVASNLFIRLRSGTMLKATEYIRTVYEKFETDLPYNAVFFNDVLSNHIYTYEKRLGKLGIAFTGLAVFISCLGLFGLSAFAAERRTKEIGIRKVMGAKVSGVVLLLIRDFIKWVVLANLIAWPVAYILTRQLLKKYAYHTSPGWEVYFLAGCASILIALLTVSFQAYKAGRTDPVRSLKYE